MTRSRKQSYTSFNYAIKQPYEEKEYKEIDAMSPLSRDALVKRFSTRMGTCLNKDVALSDKWIINVTNSI